jgi:hypothetical protein
VFVAGAGAVNLDRYVTLGGKVAEDALGRR